MAARTVRKTIGVNRNEIVPMTTHRDEPKLVSTTRPIRMTGIARIASITRLITSSTQPRR